MAGAEGRGGGGWGYLYRDPSLSPPSSCTTISVTTLSPKLSRLQWQGDPRCEGTSPPQALCGGGPCVLPLLPLSQQEATFVTGLGDINI